jgi:hypothetical protein
MRRVHRALLVLLAVVGLAFLGGIGVSYACPEAAASMPMMHHQHHGQQPPASAGDSGFCATCTAVLPSVAPLGRHLVSPIALFDIGGVTLSGIDIALDPPPPRFG